MALEPGLERTDAFVVEERMLTDVDGSLGVRVLSTPAMIAVMERNAAVLSQQHLEAGKATVGFEVCVRHVARALEGAGCTVSARLREAVEGRKLRFDVEVRQGERTIGTGTHERRVIEVDEHRRSTGGHDRRSAIVELNGLGGSPMPESIVVGTDGSERAACAIQEATRLAEALGADLHIVSAFEPLRGARIPDAPEGAAKVWAPLPDAHADAVLGAACAAVRTRDVQVTSHAVAKDPADALLEVANEVDASLIVVGNKGMHGAKRFVLGSVPNKVSHQARCNVLIVATQED